MSMNDFFWEEDMDISTTMSMDDVKVLRCEICNRLVDFNFMLEDFIIDHRKQMVYPILICPECYREKHPPKRDKRRKRRRK